MFFVGILTALVAVSIDVSVEELSKLKYGFLRKLTDMGVEGISYNVCISYFSLNVM